MTNMNTYITELRSLIDRLTKKSTDLDNNNDFGAHGSNEFSYSHGERDGIDFCIDELKFLLSQLEGKYDQ